MTHHGCPRATCQQTQLGVNSLSWLLNDQFRLIRTSLFMVGIFVFIIFVQGNLGGFLLCDVVLSRLTHHTRGQMILVPPS